MNYNDDTINDESATKQQRRQARALQKQQEKKNEDREMGLTTRGKPRKNPYRKQAAKTCNGAHIFYQRVPNEGGYVTAQKV